MAGAHVQGIFTMHDSILLYNAALRYAKLDFSIIPVDGKKPALRAWAKYQHERADYWTIHRWHRAGILRGFGVVCGRISNCVVIDLDGDEAVNTWRAAFPHLLDTYTVTSGSGHGQHLYYRPAVMPPTARITGYELRSDGCYVVAPPSPHPSGQPYAVFHRAPIMQPHNLDDVLAWLRARAPHPLAPPRVAVPTVHRPLTDYQQRGREYYFNVALEGEYDRVARATDGSRNDTLFFATRRMAGLLAAANMSEVVVIDRMSAAAAVAGLPAFEAARTIESGIRSGLAKPRNIPVK
jgi:hypothetical protein